MKYKQIKKTPLILIGGGGHCLSCIDVIEQIDKYEIIGILDLPQNVGKKVLNYEIIGTDDDIAEYSYRGFSFVITIGQIKSSKIREAVYKKIKNLGGNLPIIISEFSHVSEYAKIDEGTIIMHHVVINSSVNIGCCCIINTMALVEHESTIGDFCHISTSARINGQTRIGKYSFIGSNSVVANKVTISELTVIGAGSLVLKNIESPGIYFGNPLKKNKKCKVPR